MPVGVDMATCFGPQAKHQLGKRILPRISRPAEGAMQSRSRERWRALPACFSKNSRSTVT